MQNALTKYKIGFSFIGVFVAVVFLSVLFQANATKQDDHTRYQADKISSTLGDYISDKYIVPETLKAAGVKGEIPDTITYERLSVKSYKFCVTYKTESSGFSASQAAGELLYGGSYDSYDSDYDGAVTITQEHRKGRNCQVIKPDLRNYSQETEETQEKAKPTNLWYNKNADGSYNVCGVHANYYDAQGHVTEPPKAQPGTLAISAISYPVSGARQLFMVSATSQFFDGSCNPLTYGDIKVGDTLSVFNIIVPNASAISVFVKLPN